MTLLRCQVSLGIGGGSWRYYANTRSVVSRGHNSPDFVYYYGGFRVCR